MTGDPLAVLTSGTTTVVPEGGLAEKLASGRPLRIKLGLDPTAPSVTLGWAVVLRKLRRFQELGHLPVLIIGDFTARVGDPSGRSATRPPLSKAEVEAFAEPLLEQFGRILDMSGVELRRNSEWLEPLDVEGVLKLTATTTVARMLERDDFAARFAAHQPISLMEFMYPLLQGYDSVMVQADVELGGSDQLFNLLVGRELQRDAGQEPQVALTMPLLEGLDGVKKMSQSLGNYVGVTEAPDEMFGKLMSIPDDLIPTYVALAADMGEAERDRVRAGLADRTLHPNDEKRAMARVVIDLYHGPGAGSLAEVAFDQVHRDHQLPDAMPQVVLPADLVVDGQVWLPRLLVTLGLAASNGEARRAVAQGGVRLDGQILGDPEAEIPIEALVGHVLQLGRRRFAQVTGVGPASG